jgi:hypothetical protein
VHFYPRVNPVLPADLRSAEFLASPLSALFLCSREILKPVSLPSSFQNEFFGGGGDVCLSASFLSLSLILSLSLFDPRGQKLLFLRNSGWQIGANPKERKSCFLKKDDVAKFS